MPPRPQKSSQLAQASISEFFFKSQRPPKRASSSIIDLTDDLDGERPIKRVKREGHGASPPRRNPSGSSQPVPESPLKQKFRFIPPESPERRTTSPETSTETPQERQQKETRRKALKYILTQTFSERPPSHEGSEDENQPATTEVESDVSDAKEIKSNLRGKFTAKQPTQVTVKESVKGKQKAGTPPEGPRKSSKGKKRAEVEVGPSGEPYTPLEQQVHLGGRTHRVLLTSPQVRKLKEANPGTLLFFEVGYKYRYAHAVHRK